jgi:hypothetical protein
MATVIIVLQFSCKKEQNPFIKVQLISSYDLKEYSRKKLKSTQGVLFSSDYCAQQICI